MSFDPIPLIIKQVGLQVDLTQHEKALRELLRDAHEVYEVALEDWYTRADPSKPKEGLEANWDPEEPAQSRAIAFKGWPGFGGGSLIVHVRLSRTLFICDCRFQI